MFTEADIECFTELIDVLYGIFDKVTAQYRENQTYRSLFGFSKELEELILREKRYSGNIPIARIDLFYNEETKDFKFCEFNTDGSSAMNEDRELNHALKLTECYQELAKQYEIQTFELFDTWVETSLRIYQTIKGAVKKPNVAIVDFMESATNNEFEIFGRGNQKQGFVKFNITPECWGKYLTVYNGEKPASQLWMKFSNNQVDRKTIKEGYMSSLAGVDYSPNKCAYSVLIPEGECFS